MGSYSTLYINIVFKKETPSYITEFFHKGIVDDRVPKPFVDFNLENKINMCVPDAMICNYEAKTYIEDQPQNRCYLMILREYELDQFYLTYGLIASLNQYAEDNPLAGYIKSEFDTKIDFFAFKNEEALWLLQQETVTKPEEKLSVFELEALGHKIKFEEGTDTELKKWRNKFDKNVPLPNGSDLFLQMQNDQSIHEIVDKCLHYKPN